MKLPDVGMLEIAKIDLREIASGTVGRALVSVAGPCFTRKDIGTSGDVGRSIQAEEERVCTQPGNVTARGA